MEISVDDLVYGRVVQRDPARARVYIDDDVDATVPAGELGDLGLGDEAWFKVTEVTARSHVLLSARRATEGGNVNPVYRSESPPDDGTDAGVREPRRPNPSGDSARDEPTR